MSLYNMLHGVNPITFLLLPMLGDTHPDNYPRFRDCFLSDEDHPEYDNHIHVFTRVGGGNRHCGFGEEMLEDHPDFVASFDALDDSTYASYIFRVPAQWRPDFDLILADRVTEVSAAFQAQVRKVFPKLSQSWDALWPSADRGPLERTDDGR